MIILGSTSVLDVNAAEQYLCYEDRPPEILKEIRAYF
jgi:hypothetical protein